MTSIISRTKAALNFRRILKTGSYCNASSSQSSLDETSFLTGMMGNLGSQEADSDASSPREGSSSEVSFDKTAKPTEFSLLDMEQRAQLIDAIMIGDEAFVASALEHVDDACLEEHGRDEYGNTLLIVAVQVNTLHRGSVNAFYRGEGPLPR